MTEQIRYWTLADSAGTAWYVYPNTDGELVITNTEPTEETDWERVPYVQYTDLTTEADSGIIYVTLGNWFVYPNTDGELIITDTEPS